MSCVKHVLHNLTILREEKHDIYCEPHAGVSVFLSIKEGQELATKLTKCVSITHFGRKIYLDPDPIWSISLALYNQQFI